MALVASAFLTTALTASAAAENPTQPTLPPVNQVDEANQFAPTGLYPLWESNGFVLGHRQMLLGSSNAEFGIGDIAQVGIKPSEFVFRVPNLHVKLSVFHTDRLFVAAQVSTFVVWSGAAKAFFSPTYTSGLGDFGTIYVVPVSVAVTYRVTPWLNLHNTLTGQVVVGREPVETSLTAGDFVTAELVARRYHSIFLHVGEVGFAPHEFALLGASYRLAYGWFEGRIGYFYRLKSQGRQSGPLFSVALLL